MFSISKCPKIMNAPIVLSWPHFLHANTSFIEAVDGMRIASLGQLHQGTRSGLPGVPVGMGQVSAHGPLRSTMLEVGGSSSRLLSRSVPQSSLICQSVRWETAVSDLAATRLDLSQSQQSQSAPEGFVWPQ